jgi:aspartyl-tRNA(Asn)/glutamyl-tRNA(Gln) amidotransferase subunit A
MIYKTIDSIKNAYISGEVTPFEYIKNICESIKVLDQDVCSLVKLYPENALLQLENLVDKTKIEDANFIAGEKVSEKIFENFPLFAIPFLVKDNILVEGFTVTAQSKILENYKAVYTADVILKLQKAGAIVIGQTNMDEFAFGSSTEFSGFGNVTRNPSDLTKVAGGTSGGSAAAVALGLVPFALGTDTGGSIRQPASFTGTYGLRPTYGSVSRFGVIPSASSFDQVGPIANSLEDLEIIYKIIGGVSSNDQTSIKLIDHKAPLGVGEKIKIAYVKEFQEGIDVKVGKVFSNFLKSLSSNTTFEVIEIELPLTKYILPVYYILQTVEAASNLERFDQIRFAKSCEILNSSELYFKPREEKLGEEVKRRIMLGTFTSSAGYYDAYYNKACQVRSMIQKEYADVFNSGIDAILMPASPFPAFEIGGKITDPMAMYTADIMTVSQPIARIPAIVIPFTKVDELPVGLQIVGKEGSDLNLIKIADQLW